MPTPGPHPDPRPTTSTRRHSGANRYRYEVPTPALMRRATKRMLIALAGFLLFSSPFTVGGVSLLATGNLPGLPFAVGGAVLQLAALIAVAAALSVRWTLLNGTVSARALSGARKAVIMARTALVATIAGLLIFALIRVAAGDYWSLGTTLLVTTALGLTAAALRRTGESYDDFQGRQL